ncbi:CBO0543 family protein [Halalkalibacter flavus]|uniref:CBO0543 family protein n=1 Tax=Halalkalibacter flavus TaxID=3090668 RepID=UPI002FCCAC64
MRQRHKQIALILIILLLNLYLRTWKGLSKYYKSMLYTSFINALYYYIFKRNLLWEFKPGGMNWRLLRKIHTFFLSPVLVLLFLSRFPTSFINQVIYTMKWVLASSFAEYFLEKRKMIRFKYGWNVIWSGLIYLQMYLFSYFFLKKPVMVWALSFFSVLFYMTVFKVPLTGRLLRGPYLLFIRKKKYPLMDNFKTCIYPYYSYLLQELKRKPC